MTGCTANIWRRLVRSTTRRPRSLHTDTASTLVSTTNNSNSLEKTKRFNSTTATTSNEPAPPPEALDFIQFLNASPSPFHAVNEAALRLERAGFEKISERSSWNLKRKGKYYFTRNGSSIVAFVIGGQYRPGNGFSIIGAHTDSPCLKVKPISKKDKAGYLEVGVQLYGGGIWHTWFDRDLSVAGRVMVEKPDGTFQHTLARIEKPLLRVPTLAIHLDGSVNEAFRFNKENRMVPVLATAVKSSLSASSSSDQEAKHHRALMDILSEELKVGLDKIHDFELCLYDTQPATIGGAYDEFIFSARLDNLGMSYCSLMAMLNTADKASDDTNIRVISLFDNEEVGSTTAHGANSNLLPSTLQRLVAAKIDGKEPASGKSNFELAMRNSMLVSADMAHAVHPNYTEKYEENHRPAMHKGTVIKINAYQRYATTAPTALILREIARRRSVPIQEFVVRNDSPCGSTIGPMLSAKLGLRTIDVGNPQLSMHSIREISGVDDVPNGIRLLAAFFELFPSVDKQVVVD
ncbi:peptidase M18 [Zychaea mexicana]|uniref:peptidase M18 n=1 Tax=Zychaea mexicana TaxID=64656 RepID=UPI0022FE4B70|nr:peptidase M18 [Zychaea mexicana]KAI9490293.1 peptidase M18 [Zychaea mexicana]